MNIRLGNLSEKEIESRMGIIFTDDLKQFMKENRQHNASNIKKGKWHCFDLPFELACGDIDTATKIYEALKSQSENVKVQLKISISN